VDSGAEVIGCIRHLRMETKTLCGRVANCDEFLFDDRRHAMLYRGPKHPMKLTVCEECAKVSDLKDKAEADALAERT
jgi:hypothetical protein